MKHAAAGEGRASIPRRATREGGSSRDGSLRAALQTPPNSPVLSPPSTAGTPATGTSSPGAPPAPPRAAASPPRALPAMLRCCVGGGTSSPHPETGRSSFPPEGECSCCRGRIREGRVRLWRRARLISGHPRGGRRYRPSGQAGWRVGFRGVWRGTGVEVRGRRICREGPRHPTTYTSHT